MLFKHFVVPFTFFSKPSIFFTCKKVSAFAQKTRLLTRIKIYEWKPSKTFPFFFPPKFWSYCETTYTLVKLVIASSFLFDKVFYDLLLYLSPCFLVQPNLILQSAGGIFSFLSTPHLTLSDALGITKMNGRRGLKAP